MGRPRWRAKTRHRLDRRPSTAGEDAAKELAAWLAQRQVARVGLAAIEALDWTAYLRDTSHIELPPGERLRRLAIELEDEAASAPMPRGFLALARLYDAARELGSAEADTSLAIAAHACAGWEDTPSVHSIRVKGTQAARRAIAARDDALAHYVLGLFLYGEHALADALASFDATLARDPMLEWARLYRAHCLHDAERWSEAVAAYDAVNPAAFTGPTVWRYDLLREQRAFCRLMAGDREGALADFERLLALYEKEPHRMQPLTLGDLRRAATRELAPELGDRVVALLASDSRIER
jgi:tetratricopeptide (TPR) repeat protein